MLSWHCDASEEARRAAQARARGARRREELGAPMLSIIPVARIMTEEMAMVGHA
jgi:hypothetical protein